MRRLVLVRHGDAAAGWGDDLDPGLSERGQSQARHVATSLDPLGPLPVVTSPLRRCRETAAPIGALWGVEPVIDERVGEIAAPDHDLATRSEWLSSILSLEWSQVSPELQRWRAGVIAGLLELEQSCVVVSHFVAINVAIGAATVDDRIVCRRVGNCSTTMFETDGQTLMLVAAPAEAAHTEVL